MIAHLAVVSVVKYMKMVIRHTREFIFDTSETLEFDLDWLRGSTPV